MDFVGAIKAGFLNYVNFRGTATRPEFWYWFLFTTLVGIVTSALEATGNIATGFIQESVLLSRTETVVEGLITECLVTEDMKEKLKIKGKKLSTKELVQMNIQKDTKKAQEKSIAIQDYGNGISPEDLEHVFERFYRSSAHEAISGTGLGLSIAKEIMVAHAGEIEIQSDLGEGTTVTLLFPAIRKWGQLPK
jgi:light-regulated signal transduction histidine kinase (bacteriophytochrome)